MYSFTSDLTPPTLIYSAQNIFSPSDGYFIQTAADESSGELFIAVASATTPFNSVHDYFEIIKKPLLAPLTATSTVGLVHFTSTAVSEFCVYGNSLIINNSFGYVKMNRSSGLTTSLTSASNTLSNFGVDARGRLWSFMYENNISKYLMSHDSIERSLKIAEFPIFYSDFPSVVGFREFIKLQSDGKFGMLYVNNSNELAVYQYNSSF